MNKIVVMDIWTALSVTFKDFCTVIVAISFTVFTAYVLVDFETINFVGYLKETMIYASPFIVLKLLLVYWANKKYVIDHENKTFTFPRTDMENSIIAIILFFPYFNMMRRKTISFSEIDNFYLDTKRWSTDGVGKGSKKKKHVRYNLNVVGSFGSANLEFLSRQKRDEVRNGIARAVKEVTNKNVDSKVAEFN